MQAYLDDRNLVRHVILIASHQLISSDSHPFLYYGYRRHRPGDASGTASRQSSASSGPTTPT